MSTTPQDQAPPRQEWWCNFCNFKTDDQAAYLAHSCAEELAKQGKAEQEGEKQDHCG